MFYNSFTWLCKLFVLLFALQHISITLHSTIPLNYFAICLHPFALCIIFFHHLTMRIFSIALCSTISFHHIVPFLHHLVLQIPLQLFYITLFTLLHHVIHCSFFSIALYLAPTHFVRFSFCYANLHFVVHLFFMICSHISHLVHHLIHHPSHNKGPSSLTSKICVFALLFLLFIYTKSFFYALVLLFI